MLYRPRPATHISAMAILKIARMGHPVLRRRAQEIDDPAAPEGAEVPDPYYGSGDGFERVLDICEAACAGLLSEVTTRLAAGTG